MHVVASEGNLKKLKEILTHKPQLKQINSTNERGHTPLYCAARNGHLEIVKWLINLGADPDIPQKSTKSTPLHAASFYGHKDIVEYLLDRSANPSIKNSYGHIPEDEARDHVKPIFENVRDNPWVQAIAGNLNFFQTKFASLNIHIDTQNKFDQTILYCACKKGNVEIVRWLLEKGAHHDIRDRNLSTPLHAAAYYNHIEVVKLLLLEYEANPNVVNRWGSKPRDENISPEMVKVFDDDFNANVFEKAKQGEIRWFRYYLLPREDIHVNVTNPNDKNNSLIHIAIQNKKLDFLKWLLCHGVNIDIQNSEGDTPLHLACKLKLKDFVEILLQNGANPYIQNNEKKLASEIEQTFIDYFRKMFDAYESMSDTQEIFQIQIFNPNDNNPILKTFIHAKTMISEVIDSLAKANSNLSKDGRFLLAGRILNFPGDTPLLYAIFCCKYSNSNLCKLPISLCYDASLKISGFAVTPKDSVKPPPFKKDKFQEIIAYPSQDTSFVFETNNFKMEIIFPQSFLRSRNSLSMQFYPIETFPPFYFIFSLKLSSAVSFNGQAFPRIASIKDQNGNEILHRFSLYFYCNLSFSWYSYDDFKLPSPNINYGLIDKKPVIPGVDLHIPFDIIKKVVSDAETGAYHIYLIVPPDLEYQEKAFHGTNLEAIDSILYDGLVSPGTFTSSGKIITPPSNHFSREVTFGGFTDWANAIFVSPSLGYASHLCYAARFPLNNQNYYPILECRVRKNSYTTCGSTVKNFTPEPDQNPEELEWRIPESKNVYVTGVLLIPDDSQGELDKIAARTLRTTLTGLK